MTTNYREILRLESLGLNKTDIASAAQCARKTVSTTLARAKVCGLRWPLPEGMSDKELEERLFPSAPGKVVYKMPDYAHVHREMQRQGVTLTLLWLEYCDQCKAEGAVPYQSTQFNKAPNFCPLCFVVPNISSATSIMASGNSTRRSVPLIYPIFGYSTLSRKNTRFCTSKCLCYLDWRNYATAPLLLPATSLTAAA